MITDEDCAGIVYRVPLVPDHRWTFVDYDEAFPGQYPRTEEPGTVGVSLDHNEGGTSGDFMIKWRLVGNSEAPRLEVFHDGWGVLHLSGLVGRLADLDGAKPTKADIKALLSGMGMVEITARYKP